MSPRTAVRTLAITAVTGLGLTALAAPALANDTITLTGNLFDPTTVSLSQDSVSGTGFTFVNLSNPAASLDLFEPTGTGNVIESSSGTNCTNSSSERCEVPNTEASQSAVFTIQPGVTTATIIQVTQGGALVKEFTVTYSDSPSPDPDPTPSPGGSSAAAAPIYDLTFDPTETDASCSVAGVSAPRGTWVTVEAASGCVAPRTNPDATLLGWATDPDFSVEIAQRQIDNGWGAYETFDSDGELTGVFIPAGGTTLLTSPRNLHAIWSS